MNNYFSLVADEFRTRSRQLREFIPSHGPSIGSANEVLLRDFLQTNLPKWFSVGHGFILSSDHDASREIDVLVYRSLLYAPLFSIRDFVIAPPESVVAAVEVKTRVNKGSMHDALINLIAAKRLNPQVVTSLFIYNPPSIQTIQKYLQSFNFSAVEARHFPDNIYGLSKFHIQSTNVVLNRKKHGVGFIDMTSPDQVGQSDFIFEQFFFDLYRRLEISMNHDLKKGVDNKWVIHLDGSSGDSSAKTQGRIKYARPTGGSCRKLLCFTETNGLKKT